MASLCHCSLRLLLVDLMKNLLLDLRWNQLLMVDWVLQSWINRRNRVDFLTLFSGLDNHDSLLGWWADQDGAAAIVNNLRYGRFSRVPGLAVGIWEEPRMIGETADVGDDQRHGRRG